MYSVASLFSGIGGLDLGFEWEGYEVVWASDICETATRSYTLNFGREAVLLDINEYNISSIPDTEVIIGGPPCQSFSLVGQRRENDPRGQLVFRFRDIITEKMPLGFVMENVPGMAASYLDGERLPDYLQLYFTKLGYNVLKCSLLATDYLVPQKRRRIFLIGSLRNMPLLPNKLQFAIEKYQIDYSKFDIGAESAIGDLGEPVDKGESASYRRGRPSLFAQRMREFMSGGVTLHEYPRMSETDKKLVRAIPPGGNYMDIPKELETKRIRKFKQTGGRTTTYGRLHPRQPAYTINTYFRRPNVGCNFHYSEPRLITAREAMRFQAIPDHFNIIYTSNDKRNSLIGNAVPSFMAQAVASSLKESLRECKIAVPASYRGGRHRKK